MSLRTQYQVFLSQESCLSPTLNCRTKSLFALLQNTSNVHTSARPRDQLCIASAWTVIEQRIPHDVDCLARRHSKDFTSADDLGWMKRFVRVDRVIAALNPDVPVDELLSRVDLTRCPAVNLFLSAHLARVRANQAVRDNDVDDWMIVHIVPFADVVLTERNLAHFIRQADPSLGRSVTHDPEAAIEILRPWIGESGYL